MRESKSVSSLFVLSLFICSLAFSTPGQEKQVDTKKLYEEISGQYEFYVEGQVTVLSFFAKDGELYGRSGDGDEEVLCEPVDLEAMSFEATSMDGEFFEITFSRDEDNKVTKCLILTEGMEVEGTKIVGHQPYSFLRRAL